MTTAPPAPPPASLSRLLRSLSLSRVFRLSSSQRPGRGSSPLPGMESGRKQPAEDPQAWPKAGAQHEGGKVGGGWAGHWAAAGTGLAGPRGIPAQESQLEAHGFRRHRNSQRLLQPLGPASKKLRIDHQEPWELRVLISRDPHGTGQAPPGTPMASAHWAPQVLSGSGGWRT